MSLPRTLRPLSVAFWLHLLLACLSWAPTPAAGFPAPSTWFRRSEGQDQNQHQKRGDCRQRNFNTISSIYNNTVYPNQKPVFDKGVIPGGLFNENVTGRVDPVGTFSGLQDSIEYFFALSPLPTQNAVSAAITGYQITEFSSECDDVAASVVYLFSSIVNPGAANDGMPLPTLKQVRAAINTHFTASHPEHMHFSLCSASIRVLTIFPR
jgi:hypothetical protein